jgi:hypothetical protein
VISHVLLMALFAFCVSTVFAALMRDDARAQVRFGAALFAGFIGVAFALGWLMYPLPL